MFERTIVGALLKRRKKTSSEVNGCWQRLITSLDLSQKKNETHVIHIEKKKRRDYSYAS